MDLKKYDELRKKIHTKDFEGKNKNLDNWLYKLSFLGNLGSIFFAYFLVSPALKKAISLNLISGQWGIALAILITILILVSFETIKRLLIKNLSFDLVKNKFKILKASIFGWFIFSTAVVCLSFYLSLNGARNFASTSFQRNEVAQVDMQTQIDSVTNIYSEQMNIYTEENDDLRERNNEVRQKYSETPLNYRTVRNELQATIDKNTEIINTNLERIDELNADLSAEIAEIRETYKSATDQNQRDDIRNIWLFILISTSIEILIIVGVYFREYYEYNLYRLHEERLETVYQKRDRYKTMLRFVYQDGEVHAGQRVMGAAKIIDAVEENTRIPNPKKFVETFLEDMEKIGIFVTEGKRRMTQATYSEALSIVEEFDDSLRILENLK